MSAQSIPAVVMAGISFYVGLYHLLIYVQRKQRRQDLTFALLCLSTGLYDVFCAGLYNANSVIEGAQWQRMQFIALAFLTTAFLWFVSDYLRQKPGTATYIFSAYYLLACLAQIFDRSTLTWLIEQPAIKEIAFPLGGRIVYYEVTLGPLTVFQGLLGMAASTYILWIGARAYWRGNRQQAIPLLAALSLMYAAAVNDTLVSNNVYPFVYTIEYGYMALLTLMTYSLSSTIVEATKTKEVLRASEERFRALVETTSDWVWETDANGIYTYASPRVRDLLGYAPEEIVGKTPFDLMPPDEIARINALFWDTWNGHQPFERLENTARHKKGHLVVLETNGMPFFGANGKLGGYRGIDRDITERKRVEASLAKRAAELRALYEGSLDINAQSDIVTLLHKIVERVAPLTGIQQSALYLLRPDQTLEMVCHHNLQDRFLGTHLDMGEGLAGRAVQEGKLMMIEDYQQWDGRAAAFDKANIHRALSVPLKTRNRTIGALNVIDSELTGPFDDDQVRLLGLFADQAAIAIENAQLYLEAQQRAEQLATMNEIGRAISTLQDLDSVLEVVYHQVQRIVPADAFYISLHDPVRDEMSFPIVYDLGVRYQEPTIPRSPGSWLDHVLRTAQPFMMHRSAQELQTPIQGCLGDQNRKSASILIVPLWQRDHVAGVLSIQSYTMNAYNNQHAEILTGIGIQAMIAIENAKLFTAARQELEERKRIQAELEAKNAELERFTYTVSHDLKSPLITIGSFIGFVEKDALAGDAERVHTDMVYINDAVAKMQRLLDELLDLSRIGRQMNPAQEVSFAEIVDEAIAMVRGRIVACGATVEVAPDLPAIRGDRARLVEVMQNLLDNACKFMGNQPHPNIEIGARRGEDGLVFYVRDNGAGIDPPYHDKVFDLFEKLDPGSEGTGVGLALVKRIVETHGGNIWVESDGQGSGTTFCFTLLTAGRI